MFETDGSSCEILDSLPAVHISTILLEIQAGEV